MAVSGVGASSAKADVDCQAAMPAVISLLPLKTTLPAPTAELPSPHPFLRESEVFHGHPNPYGLLNRNSIQAIADLAEQGFLLERLDHETCSAGLHASHDRVPIAMTGDH